AGPKERLAAGKEPRISMGAHAGWRRPAHARRYPSLFRKRGEHLRSTGGRESDEHKGENALGALASESLDESSLVRHGGSGASRYSMRLSPDVARRMVGFDYRCDSFRNRVGRFNGLRSG